MYLELYINFNSQNSDYLNRILKTNNNLFIVLRISI